MYGVSPSLIHSLSAVVLTLLIAPAQAVSVSERLQDFVGTASSSNEILPPEQAFPLSALSGGTGVDLIWEIQDGYYLYRDKFTFSAIDNTASVDTTAISFPQGEVKEDEAFGRVEVYFGTLTVHVPVTGNTDAPVRLRVGFQGCKDKSVCYPPQTQEVAVQLSRSNSDSPPVAPAGITGSLDSANGLRGAGFLANVIAFFGFGLLLSLTPCIFPMIPILSGIIVGHGERISHGRGFALSLVYVVAMAVTYAALGLVAGLTRFNLQAAAQAPWIIVLFSGVFLFLALSMFGVFRLQMPVFIQSWISHITYHQRAGTLRGSAVMGALCALIAGPCVAPPLAGALLYVTQTGDALLGGAALFALGMGMGVPLLVLGASAGYLLPRAGMWMESMRRACGFVMVGVAVWFLGRILPGPLTLLLWGLLFLAAAMFMGALERLEGDGSWRRAGKAFGLAFLVYGATLVVGAASGGDDPLRPLAPLTGGGTAQAEKLPFKRIASLTELRLELKRAGSEGRPVMLDFYADWCITCKELEQKTFPDPRVQAKLSNVLLLQADVTGYTHADQQLLQEFDLYGPPAILFFDATTRELPRYRLGEFVGADEFLAHLDEVLSS